MKIIKKLEHKPCDEKLREWFRDMLLFNRILNMTILLNSILYWIISPKELSPFIYDLLINIFVCKSFSQYLVFFGLVISDLYSTEKKGSSAFIISLILKTIIIVFMIIAFKITFSSLSNYTYEYTSIPCLLGLLIVSQNSFLQNEKTINILGLPFQIKKKFYPLVLILIFQMIKIRIDIIFVYPIGLLIGFSGLNSVLIRLGNRIQKYLCCCLLKFESFARSNLEIVGGIQQIAASNSTVFEQL